MCHLLSKCRRTAQIRSRISHLTVSKQTKTFLFLYVNLPKSYRGYHNADILQLLVIFATQTTSHQNFEGFFSKTGKIYTESTPHLSIYTKQYISTTQYSATSFIISAFPLPRTTMQNTDLQYSQQPSPKLAANVAIPLISNNLWKFLPSPSNNSKGIISNT